MSEPKLMTEQQLSDLKYIIHEAINVVNPFMISGSFNIENFDFPMYDMEAIPPEIFNLAHAIENFVVGMMTEEEYEAMAERYKADPTKPLLQIGLPGGSLR